MTLAEKYCLTAAFVFFMVGLLAGIWKYLQMIQSENCRSRYYVDSAHSTSFLYAVSALLLGVFARHSVFPDLVNEIAALSALIFFGTAIGLNVINGLKSDTRNQIKASRSGTPGFSPMWLVHSYTAALIIAEVGGSSVLGIGALLSVWSG